MKAWTDTPIEILGDIPWREAPIRQVEVLSCDCEGYCQVKVFGKVVEIKSEYLYQKKGRYCEVPGITLRQRVCLRAKNL